MVFRKKPVIIEAVQLQCEEQKPDVTPEYWPFKETPDWLTKAMDEGILYPKYSYESDFFHMEVSTLEGKMLVSPGDWIIRGINGELYTCKPDIFKKTYEPVEPRKPYVLLARKNGKMDVLKAEVESAVSGMVEEYNRYIQVKIGLDDDKTEWANACLKECKGITKEALEKGVISFALDWILKHNILDVFDPNMPREKEIPKEEAAFMGVRIWEKEESDE